jgi:chloride channel protein, CIC family
MLPLAVTTGVLTGALAWLLISIVEAVQHELWTAPAPAWQLLLIPTVGGLLVVVFVERVVPESRGGGVVTTLQTIPLRGGRFRARVPLAGAAATGVALGTGARDRRSGPAPPADVRARSSSSAARSARCWPARCRPTRTAALSAHD